MKTNSIPNRLLGACLFAVSQLAAASATHQEQLAVATPAACQGGNYKAVDIVKIQTDLTRIYASDPGFKDDVGEGIAPLRDGVLGRITRKWLGVFCTRHVFQASVNDVEASVVSELARVAAGAGETGRPAEKSRVGSLPTVETYYSYDPKAALKPKNIDLIVSRLRTLTDRYHDKSQFEAAVRRALTGLELNDDTLKRIVQVSAVDGYRLADTTVSDLRGISEGLAAKLQPMKDTVYEHADQFHADLKMAVGDGKEKIELAKLAAPIDASARVDNYRIPDTIAADLIAAGELEPPVAALYSSMANVAYPSKELFDSAMAWRVERALGMCPENRYRREGRLEDDGEVRALLALTQDKGPPIDRVIELRRIAGRCDEAQLKEAKKLSSAAHEVLLTKVHTAAQTVHLGAAPPQPAGATANKSWCGCAPDAKDGTAYGFYPLWTDSTNKKIDFAVLSRIGLYGMTIDDSGELNLPPGVNSAPFALLEAAHRHMTKVDLVLYKNDWQVWARGDDNKKKATFQKMAKKIVELLGTPLRKTDWYGTALASLGFERGPSMGDGITLRFEGFPAADWQLFNDFAKQLYQQLQSMKPARQLNIMVTQGELLDGQASTFSTSRLHALMNNSHDLGTELSPAESKRFREKDIKVLVLLEEPTADAKLALRGDIEKTLFSSGRVRMLRNVIPIVEYDGVRPQQLGDDIIYFSDNFGGIGFWPLSFAPDADSAEDATTANAVLLKHFRRADSDGGVFERVTDFVTDFVCPNRAWLRWLAWISVVFGVWAGLKFATCSGCETRLDKNGLYRAGMVALIVLPVIVVAALVMGDPLFNGVPWIFAALLIALIAAAYALLKPTRNVP